MARIGAIKRTSAVAATRNPLDRRSDPKDGGKGKGILLLDITNPRVTVIDNVFGKWKITAKVFMWDHSLSIQPPHCIVFFR